MKYMGSKNRIAKFLLPIILKDRKENQWYVEPFVGGANIIDKVNGLKLGIDKNKYIIAMWKGLQENLSRPTEIPKELYDRVRNEYNNQTNIEFDDFMIGWIGWMASFNGRFFDGGYSGKASGRDYVSEQMRNTEKQIKNLLDVQFVHGSYDEINIPPKSIIYCDIPYKDTKQYITSKDFNHEVFWNWCREMSLDGHTIFVSEYQAPDDFKCVWEKEVTNSMNATITYNPIEKLFTI